MKTVDEASKTLLDIIKLSPMYLIGIMLFTGSLLIIGANETWMSFFGIKKSSFNKVKIWDAIVFLFTASLLLAHVISVIVKLVKDNWLQRGNLKSMKRRLHELTYEEKQILSSYIFNKTKTRDYNINDGVVQGLAHANILYRASNLSKGLTLFSYNIQPWAWDYLNKHKNLLEVPIDEIM